MAKPVLGVGFVAGLSLALCSLGALASDTFEWKAAVSDGYWDVSDNWQSSSGGCPGAADTVKLAAGSTTMTLRDDVEVLKFAEYQAGRDDANPSIPVINLNGSALRVAATSGQPLYAASTEPYAVRDLNMPYTYIAFRDGTLDCSTAPGLIMGWCSHDIGSGGFLFDNVRFTGKVADLGWQGCSRITLRNGTVWVNLSQIRTSAGPSHKIGQPFPYLCVTGENTKLVSPEYDILVAGDRGDLYVLDGGEIETRDLRVGATSRSVDVRARIENGTALVRGDLWLGTDDCESKSDYAPLWPAGHGSQLIIAGQYGRVVVTNENATFRIFENTGSALSFELPTNGFADETGAQRAPLLISGVTSVPRPGSDEPGYVADYGETRLVLKAGDWSREHPNETQVLIHSVTAAHDAYARLIAHASFSDIPQSVVDAGQAPSLSVSGDGKDLCLTAPDIDVEPVLSGSAAAAQTVGCVDVTVNVLSYGFGASSAVRLELVYSESEDFSTFVTTNLLAGTSPVTESVPFSLSFAIPGWPQHRDYFAKVVLENEKGGRGETAVFRFETNGFAEILYWSEARDGNWEDVGRWTLDSASGVVSESRPGREDHVVLQPQHSGAFAVKLSADREVDTFCGTFASCVCQPVTVDADGHRFTSHGLNPREGAGYSYSYVFADASRRDDWITAEGDYRLPSACLTLANGDFSFPFKDSYSGAYGFVLGRNGAWGNGALCVSHATFTGDVRNWNTGSSVHLTDGGVWTPHRELLIPNHSAILRGGCLRVSGEGSKLDMPDYDLTFRTDRLGVYVLDGGRINANGFAIGGRTDKIESADKTAIESSEDTFAVVRDGTVSLGGSLTVGWSASNKCSPRLLIAGPRARIDARGALIIYENLGAKIQFEVPTNGYVTAAGESQAPLNVASVSLVARDTEFENYGATRIEIGMKGWMKAHPAATQALLTLSDPDPTALTALKDRCLVVDTRLPSGFEPVTVSDDGKRLLLNAPPRQGLVLFVK